MRRAHKEGLLLRGIRQLLQASITSFRIAADYRIYFGDGRNKYRWENIGRWSPMDRSLIYGTLQLIVGFVLMDRETYGKCGLRFYFAEGLHSRLLWHIKMEIKYSFR